MIGPHTWELRYNNNRVNIWTSALQGLNIKIFVSMALLVLRGSLRSSRFLSFSKRSRTGGKLRKSGKISSPIFLAPSTQACSFARRLFVRLFEIGCYTGLQKSQGRRTWKDEKNTYFEYFFQKKRECNNTDKIDDVWLHSMNYAMCDTRNGRRTY